MRRRRAAEQQRVAARVVARAHGARRDVHEPAIRLAAVPRRDALRDDRAARVATDVDHLGAGVGLLVVGRHRHRVELAHRIVALEDAARILPGDRRARLDLGPGDLRALAAAGAALGDEVVDPAESVLVARVPVLDGRVLDGRVVERDQLDHGGVELVLVALGRRAALEIADARALVGDQQRALELPGARGVDPEIGRELHRAAHALRNVGEGAVGEDRRVEGREEVVRVRHHGAQVLAHQLGMILHRLRERAEEDALLLELRLEGGGDGDAVEDGVDRHAGEALLLEQRDAELFVGAQQLRIDLVEARQLRARLRRRVVDDLLVVDLRVVDHRPARLGFMRGHLEKARERLEPPCEQPLGLVLLARDQADDALVQARRHRFGFDVGDEAVLILALGELLEGRVL